MFDVKGKLPTMVLGGEEEEKEEEKEVVIPLQSNVSFRARTRRESRGRPSAVHRKGELELCMEERE